MIAFSIPEKMFLKIESLMCVLRAHINRTLYINIYKFFHKTRGGRAPPSFVPTPSYYLTSVFLFRHVPNIVVIIIIIIIKFKLHYISLGHFSFLIFIYYLFFLEKLSLKITFIAILSILIKT